MAKKLLLLILAFCNIGFLFAVPPTFNNQIEKPLTTDTNGQQETVYTANTFGISANNSLKQNLYTLFSPLNNNSLIWNMIRTIMTGVLIIYIIRAGIEILTKATDEAAQKKARRSFLYMILGAFLIWGAVWILGTALKVGTVQGTQGLLSNLQNNLLFQILAFMKGLAFFYAIIMFLYYGFQFMRAMEEENKIKAARTGILNVITALVLIKVIDFIFYIAQQQDFGSRLQQFVLNAARIGAYILGAGMVLALIW